MGRKKKPDNRKPQEIIADMCGLLEGFGVTGINCSYSGENEDGEVDSIWCRFAERMETGAQHFPLGSAQLEKNEPNIIGGGTMSDLHNMLSTLMRNTDAEPALITAEEAEKFKRSFEDILPVDWCEGPGSYGDITVNTINKRIEVRHNRRIITVETFTLAYSPDDKNLAPST